MPAPRHPPPFTAGEARDLRFPGEGFVFDAVWGGFHRLSPSAAGILRALRSGTPPQGIPALLAARYGIEEPRATRDAERFLQELHALGLAGEGT